MFSRAVGDLPRLAMVVAMTLAIIHGVADAAEPADQAQQILAETGVKGGLVVHVRCGDGRLTAALRPNESYIVHGLDADAGNVAQARAHIRSLGLYGKVAVERWAGSRLPYADNLVNLLVSADLGKIPMREAMRVLAPHGVAYVKPEVRGQRSEVSKTIRAQLADLKAVNVQIAEDGWVKFSKPRPKETDEWTHYLHDASGNPVAHDSVVGPPRHVQWVEGPRHARSHEHTPSVIALVSTGGRIFYIADEAPAASMRRPGEWHLVARDAYNGTLLWKRPIASWFSHLCGWTSGPLQLQRKLVAVGNRVYVTLGFHAPLTALDAATGDTVKAYAQTHGTEEVLCHKGILLLVARSVTDERIAELAKWAKLAGQKKSPLDARETMLPVLKRFRRTEAKAARTVLALDADTGRLLWKKAGKDVAWLRPLSLCAVGDRVFCQKGRNVVCLDLRTGREVWSAPSSRLRVACDSTLVCADRRTITALSAETGKPVWTQEPLLVSIRDAFVVNGSLWLGGFKAYDTGRKHTGPAWGPYFVTQRDLATGKVLKHVEPENPGHHHRCWQNKATDRYIIAGRRGAEFFDLKSGDVLWHSWVRGVCRYGVMPCNGLLYAPPHACGCYIAAKLDGFYALAPARRDEGRGTRDEGTTPRLERGPAYGSSLDTRHSTLDTSTAWPTYRHDAQRSGCTRSPVPAALRRKWQVDVGGKLTSPTLAGGKVFVASVDEHRISAVDADSGRTAWSFTAGARVDSPPTLHKGRAIFGCRDGYVYSLRASDGALAWRLRAARNERRIAACGQLESASPVPGSVLVHDGVAYLTAGRSSYLDGGIDLCRIQPESGKTLSRTPIYSPDPETGKQPAQFGPCYMPGALEDILSGDSKCVYLRDAAFDKQGRSQPKGSPHLFTLTGFLDDTRAHRSYWIFGTRCSLSTGCSGRDRKLIYGRLLVFTDSTIYGYGRKRVHWSNALQDGAYRLFAVKQNERDRRGRRVVKWEKPMPIQVRAMVLADKVLFVAGPLAAPGDLSDGREKDQRALLLAISASDGTELARHRLDSPPIFDGLAAANGRLYLAAQDGRVLCMGK